MSIGTNLKWSCKLSQFVVIDTCRAIALFIRMSLMHWWCPTSTGTRRLLPPRFPTQADPVVTATCNGSGSVVRVASMISSEALTAATSGEYFGIWKFHAQMMRPLPSCASRIVPPFRATVDCTASAKVAAEA